MIIYRNRSVPRGLAFGMVGTGAFLPRPLEVRTFRTRPL